MSETEPLTPLERASEPDAARVLVRSLVPEVDFRALGAGGTSASILVIEDASAVTEQLDVEGETLLDRVRAEVIVMTEPGRVAERPSPRERQRRSYRLRHVGVPDGCRCCVLAEAVVHSSNEFVVVAGPGQRPLIGLSEMLGHMWIEGAEIAVLGSDGTDLPDGIADVGAAGPDIAGIIAAWLGLAGGGHPPTTVVMRRWFAKWIFNEIDRAIDPRDEIADRIRLLGVTLIHGEPGELIVRSVEGLG